MCSQAVNAMHKIQGKGALEIYFVTGKGGVGKSAVAASLAHHLSMSGRRTLLVELGDQSFYRHYFAIPQVGYMPAVLRPQLEVCLWSGQDCLREYARHLLKIESIYKLFFENSVSKALVNVAPALPELAIMGKVTSGPPRNVGPAMKCDAIVVDAFASGHFMALLKAPRGLATAIPLGPMGEQSRSIDAVLKDGKICKYIVVSTPEELPTVEAIELDQQIYTQIGLRPMHILNRWWEIPNGENEKALHEIQQRQSLQESRLKAAVQSVRRFPFVFEPQNWPLVQALSKNWEGHR